MREVSKLTLLRCFFRAFLLQASWNFERMQNVGFLFVIEPALRALYPEKERQSAYQRHLSYFNTHPYMSAPVLGATIALEEKQAADQAGVFSVDDFKRMAMAPYAAIGDAFFWGGVRPLAACMALFFASKGSLWAPVIFLVTFNLPHLWARTVGFARGYRMGVSVVEVIQRYRLPDAAIRLKEGMIVLLGGFCAYLTVETCRSEQVTVSWGLLALPIVLLLIVMARRRVSALLLVLGVVLSLVTLFQVVKW